MGGSLTVAGKPMLCEGDDVLQNLKDVFGHPGSNEYKYAQTKKQLFLDIWNGTGDYNDLHAAYMAVRVKDSPNWKHYLSTLGADNIKRIAVARFEGLDRTKPMKTKTHNPAKGEGDHKVHWKHDTDHSVSIDSPFTPDSECP